MHRVEITIDGRTTVYWLTSKEYYEGFLLRGRTDHSYQLNRENTNDGETDTDH